MKWIKRLICRYRGHDFPLPVKQPSNSMFEYRQVGNCRRCRAINPVFFSRPADLSLAALQSARDNLIAQGGLPKTHDQN